MDLAPAARTYAKWNYTADYDPTGDAIEVIIDGTAYPATDFSAAADPCLTGRWTGIIRLLVAGPDATGNPGGTVVLGLGEHAVALHFPSAPQDTLLPAGSITVAPAAVGLASGPCSPWPTDACVVFPDCTQMVSGYALEAATEVLWARTGRRYGLCETTYRPCRTGCTPAAAWWASPAWGSGWGTGGGWGWPYPALVGGRWYNLGCGMCGDTCSCTVLHQIALPSPVATVVQVKVDGTVLDPASYRVDDWRFLVRLDGEPWPWCNDLNLADTEEGTWSVTALYGEEVPALGRLAVGELAIELAKGLCGAAGCRLPMGVLKEITRQGVRKEFLRGDKMGNQIGLYLCDLFVNTENPAGASPAAVYSMDAPRTRRVGTG